MQSFRTHTGELVEGERLTAALAKVADDWRDLAYAIRRADNYAPHVTEETKDANLARDLECAERVRAGEVKSFTIWQRVNMVLTGECVAFLP